MTTADKYRAILRDIERLIQERALRYFVTRAHGEESADLKVQCDAMTVLLKHWLEPHAIWFEAHDEEQTRPVEHGLLVLDLDKDAIEETAHVDGERHTA